MEETIEEVCLKLIICERRVGFMSGGDNEIILSRQVIEGKEEEGGRERGKKVESIKERRKRTYA